MHAPYIYSEENNSIRKRYPRLRLVICRHLPSISCRFRTTHTKKLNRLLRTEVPLQEKYPIREPIDPDSQLLIWRQFSSVCNHFRVIRDFSTLSTYEKWFEALNDFTDRIWQSIFRLWFPINIQFTFRVDRVGQSLSSYMRLFNVQ